MRTNYCGNITPDYIGTEVELFGWVNRVRNHGKLIFIDLRDRAGIVQVVVDSENQSLFQLAEGLHIEYVLHITGKVRPRPEGLVNDEMRTGAIEVEATNIDILSKAEPLPFTVDASDELRLQYRYIDLRRPEMLSKLMFRANVVKKMHAYLDALGFVEIETPVLTNSTPEGARDFLVPSRNFPGQFYALPQSPQIFKQLLMASGIDRYYQIVKCFRDEDLRADRQPEFTQLDVELSFTSENEIMQIHEELIRQLFAELLQIALPNPFPRLTYQEAITKYGIDRPDLRIPLEMVDIADVVKNSSFTVFTSAASDTDRRVVALRLPNGTRLSRKQLDGYVEFVAGYGLKGLAYLKVNDRSQGMQGLASSILKFFTQEVMEQLLDRVQAQNGDMIFFAAAQTTIVNEAFAAFRLKLGHDHGLVAKTFAPLWVTDFPMFTRTEDGWTFMHHPFTAPTETDVAKLIANPGATLARAYDMVLNGTELGGGSMRISNYDLQLAVFKIIGLSEEVATSRFGHLLEAFKYGYPPEGGIAFGLDRIVMLMTGANSIREVIAFPKTQTGACPLTHAPSHVSDAQLRELGISIKNK